MKPQKAIPVCTLFGLGNVAIPAMADGFIEDSKVSLQTKNFYLNRDFRDGSGQNKRDEWAQGFILDAKSGFTPGPVGFGIDAIGMLGLKLDSSPDRTGTGLLPVHDDGRAPDEYRQIILTLQASTTRSQRIWLDPTNTANSRMSTRRISSVSWAVCLLLQVN